MGEGNCRVDVSNRFALLEDLADDEIDIVLETIRDNIKILSRESLGYYELKTHRTWFDEGCSKLLDHRKKLNCSGYRIQVK
jgi:hypothetical protein